MRPVGEHGYHADSAAFLLCQASGAYNRETPRCLPGQSTLSSSHSVRAQCMMSECSVCSCSSYSCSLQTSRDLESLSPLAGSFMTGRAARAAQCHLNGIAYLAPVNGTVGSCHGRLEHGASCEFGCDAGFAIHAAGRGPAAGTSTCTFGNMSAMPDGIGCEPGPAPPCPWRCAPPCPGRV